MRAGRGGARGLRAPRPRGARSRRRPHGPADVSDGRHRDHAPRQGPLPADGGRRPDLLRGEGARPRGARERSLRLSPEGLGAGRGRRRGALGAPGRDSARSRRDEAAHHGAELRRNGVTSPDDPRARGAAPGRRGQGEQGDRSRAGHQRAHRPNPRLERPAQDRRELEDAGGGLRPRGPGGAARGEGPGRREPLASSAKTIGEAAASAFSLETKLRGFALAGDDPARPRPAPARRLGRVPRSLRSAAGIREDDAPRAVARARRAPVRLVHGRLRRQRPGRALDRDRRGDPRVRPDFGDAAEVALRPATSTCTMR